MTLDEKIAKMHQKHLKDWDEKKPWKPDEQNTKPIFYWRKCTKCGRKMQLGRICMLCKAKRQRERYAQRKARKHAILNT
jgi:hypothetical protein